MPIPLIAAALSAIAPSLAQRGLDLLSGVFRGALDKGTTEIADLIHEKTGIDINDAAEGKLTDVQWSQLKQFEFEYQSKLLAYRQQADANNLELEKVHQADRADARGMQKAALAGDDLFAKRFVYYYATGVTVMAFSFIFWASFIFEYPAERKEATRIIDTVLGFLLGVTLSAIIQYFFGSSVGSKAKDEKLKDLGEQMRAQAAESADVKAGGRSS
jgi:hypothetical protein